MSFQINDFSPESLAMLNQYINKMRYMLYNYDGKGIKKNTITADKIFGNLIAGKMIMTTNDAGNTVYLHEQYIDIYKDTQRILTIGFGGQANGQTITGLSFTHTTIYEIGNTLNIEADEVWVSGTLNATQVTKDGKSVTTADDVIALIVAYNNPPPP